MTSSVRNIAISLAVIGAGFASIVLVSPSIEAAKPKLPETFTDSDLSMNGSRLKGYAVGMEGLFADWYWVRSLQYIGDKMVNSTDPNINLDDLTPLNPRLLYPLLQNATDLDPHFIGAYSYGAVVLPAIDKEKAVALATKGIDNNPKEWRLYQHLGYIYWKLGQYEKAAETYGKGSEIEGSSPFMKIMAASMTNDAGSRVTARSIYRQMLSESTEESIRTTAERRLAFLDWQDERDAINTILADFRERNGRCANSFGEVATQILQTKLPEGRGFSVDAGKRLVDPTGAPYKLDREQCVVTVDMGKTKLPI